MRSNRRPASSVIAAAILAAGALHSPSLAGPPEDAAAARRLFADQKWEEAAAAYQALVEANPYNGQHWQNYGFAVHQLGRYEESLAAFQESLELGYQVETSTYNICCAHARLGQVEEALDWLQKAMDAGFAQDNLLRADTDIDNLRDDPRFREICGIWPPENLSRDERWLYDLEYLARRLEQVHYDLYGVASREQIATAFAELRSAVPTLADHQVPVRIQGILAMVGDGHTHLRPIREGTRAFHRYPVELYLYADGLYVLAAAREYADAVGGRVLRLGNATAAEAVERIRPYCSVDNAMGVLDHAPRMLAVPEVLHTLGIIDEVGDPLRLTVERPDGTETTVELGSIGFAAASIDLVTATDGAAADNDSLHLRHADRTFWFEHLPEERLVYFQYNSVQDEDDETLADFCTRLFAFIEGEGVDFLVIDMRRNGGGNNFLNKPLVHGLIRGDRINKPGHLFVITGRRTFSAAMNGAADIEADTEALFVGEPTGSRPNFVGETTVLTLPCSRVQLSCSSLYWQRSTATDDRIWIAPDLLAEPTFEAFRTGRDPAMEAILAYLKN